MGTTWIGTGRFGAATFDPLTLTNLFLWFDASDTATITQLLGAVSQINDKSGNGRHFTQGTLINQPTTNATTQNGLNVLDFDGSNDLLSRTISAVDAEMTMPWSVFTVVKRDSGTRVHFNMGFDHGFSPTTNGGGGQGYGVLFGGQAWLGTGTGSTAWTRHTLTGDGHAGTTNYVVYKDGTSVKSGNQLYNGMNGATWNIGGDNGGYDACHVGEIIVMKAVATSGERAAVDTYLSTKWGI